MRYLADATPMYHKSTIEDDMDKDPKNRKADPKRSSTKRAWSGIPPEKAVGGPTGAFAQDRQRKLRLHLGESPQPLNHVKGEFAAGAAARAAAVDHLLVVGRV